MTLPNFLIIGAAKSGTSSLYMYLKQHPEVFMSQVKEPHFFSFDHESKITTGPGDPIHEAVTDFAEYEALFNDVTTEKAIGEASTSYLYRPEAPERIYALLPDIKLIAILRNPVERAFSAYMHVVRDWRETSEDFNQALKLEESRIEAGWEPIWHFTKVGKYHEQLSRYFNLFRKEQIKVFLYDELIQDQQRLVKGIYGFLDIDPEFRPGSSAKYNVSGEIKSEFVLNASKWFFSRPNPFRWVSRKVIPESWRLNFSSWVRRGIVRKSQLPNAIREPLIETIREYIINLEVLINKDLSHWME